jgi:hypothetical protein
LQQNALEHAFVKKVFAAFNLYRLLPYRLHYLNKPISLSYNPGGTVFVGEQLNTLGRKHWQSFASQNYFDASGVFFTSLISGPLLLLLFILLVRSVSV